jgi:hypothetical protein
MTNGQARGRQRTRLDWLALVAILISAFSLRIYDINWDEGKFLHPDELFVTIRAVDTIHFDGLPNWEELTDPAISPFNPRSDTCGSGEELGTCNFSYGALPLIITDFVAETLADITGEPYDQYGDGDLTRLGRTISAIVDTITVLLVFLIGSKLFNGRTGLLGAAIYAGTPLAIQLSHFFTTDIWLAAFVSLTIWASLMALDRESLRWFAFAGASFGWALATKGSVLLLAGVVALAAVFVAYRYVDPEDPGAAIVAGLSRLLSAGIAAVIAFAMFEPYALLRAGVYIDQLQEQQMMSSGEIDFPFTRRYVGTTPVLYQAEQLLRWGMGPVAAILCPGRHRSLRLVGDSEAPGGYRPSPVLARAPGRGHHPSRGQVPPLSDPGRAGASRRGRRGNRSRRRLAGAPLEPGIGRSIRHNLPRRHRLLDRRLRLHLRR